MRIIVLGINYWPEQTGIAVFNTGRCEELVARGHDVTMVTTFPYYPQWRVPPEYRGKLFAREIHNGVTILRSFAYVPRQVTSPRRMLHEASFIASSCVRALPRVRPDVLFVVSPPLGLALSAVLLGRWWRAPYVFHVTDLQPDAAFDLDMLPRGYWARLLYWMESLAYRNAAVISTLTEGMRLRILAKGIAKEKLRSFSDWVDPALFDVPLEGGGSAARRRFGLEGKFLVVHAGNMGVKQGLDVLLGAADQLRDEADVFFVMVGDGAMRQSLQSEAQRRGLSNVRFLPLQPREMFLQLLGAADLCLVTQQSAVAEIVFPSKVVTLLGAGRPVVASVNTASEVARVVKAAGAGVVVEPQNPKALADAIRSVRSNPLLRRTMAEAGRRYAMRTWDKRRILDGAECWLKEVGEGAIPTGSEASTVV